MLGAGTAHPATCHDRCCGPCLSSPARSAQRSRARTRPRWPWTSGAHRRRPCQPTEATAADPARRARQIHPKLKPASTRCRPAIGLSPRTFCRGYAQRQVQPVRRHRVTPDNLKGTIIITTRPAEIIRSRYALAASATALLCIGLVACSSSGSSTAGAVPPPGRRHCRRPARRRTRSRPCRSDRSRKRNLQRRSWPLSEMTAELATEIPIIITPARENAR